MSISAAALKVAEWIVAGDKLAGRGRAPANLAKRFDELSRYGMHVVEKDGVAVPLDPKSFEWLWRLKVREGRAVRKIRKVIREHGGQVLPYAKLSKPSQLAMAFYMSVDGEAWPLPKALQDFPDLSRTPEFQAAFRRQRCHYVRRHGCEAFGYVELPLQTAIDMVWFCRDPGETHGSFEAYHKWYKPFIEDKHSAKDPWPSIIDTGGETFLQDGWHRFHRYVDLKLKKLPFLYYPF